MQLEEEGEHVAWVVVRLFSPWKLKGEHFQDEGSQEFAYTLANKYSVFPVKCIQAATHLVHLCYYSEGMGHCHMNAQNEWVHVAREPLEKYLHNSQMFYTHDHEIP